MFDEWMQLQEKINDDGLALKVSRQISKIVHVNPSPTHTKVPPLVFLTAVRCSKTCANMS